MSVFRHHFLQHPGSIGHVTTWPTDIELKPQGQWVEVKEQVFRWQEDKVTVLS